MIEMSMRLKVLNLSIQFNFRENMFMKGNGKIKKEMVEDVSFGKMAQFIKVIGKTILPMGSAALSTQTEMYILDSGLMIGPLEKVIEF